MRPSTTILALIGAALAVASGTAGAAEAPAPVVCGSNGCTRLPTSTLQGLLTLAEALRPADPPPAQPFLLFRLDGSDGAMHQVVYVRHEGGALLGFAGGPRWRLVPIDDAKLLADAAAGTTPYPAPAAGTPLGGLFAVHERSRWSKAPWAPVAALIGLAGAGVTAYAARTSASGRRR